MLKAADRSLWQGRVDEAEGPLAQRWHQRVRPWDWDAGGSSPGVALLGFACDAGVVRNGGRAGAAQGPRALRRALANLAWHVPQAVWDAGDVVCEGDELEAAQEAYAAAATRLLAAGQRVIGLGGGHEIAWASWRALAALEPAPRRIGIVNVDAHFDLRAAPRANSGTPFRQVAAACRAGGRRFDYLVLGISELANTAALFASARELGVRWRSDAATTARDEHEVRALLAQFCAEVDRIHFTICLDALPASVAPGVSAPAAHGVELAVVERIARQVIESGKLAIADVAELCPPHDSGERTARVAARLVARIAGSATPEP
ncbi:MAG: formimidoylglutamase [Steroidobacteraceae bacterium]